MNQLLHHYLRTRGFPTPPKPTRTITAYQHANGDLIQRTHYTYTDDNKPLTKAMTKDGGTTTLAIHYNQNGLPERLTVHQEDQLIKELTITITPNQIREDGDNHHTVITHDPHTNQLTEIETFTSGNYPPHTTINKHDIKTDNSRITTTTDIEGHTPPTFTTYDPNNINTARIWDDHQTLTHIHQHDQHRFPTKATHITKNEHRITTHEITWDINYRQ